MIIRRVLSNHIKGMRFNSGDHSDLILITRITPDLIETPQAILFPIY